MSLHEALLYQSVADGTVHCGLCAHECTIKTGATGRCGVRRNTGGTLETLIYGRLIAAHVDPIEKKPLYHFQPGSQSYSIATVGCNFTCRWCQNWEISQMPLDRKMIAGSDQSPEQTVAEAHGAGCSSISYTYTEPTVYFEYALDCARLAQENGLKNVFVTNGYMTRDALDMIGPYLDAANIDLKAFSEKTYRTYTGARLAPVVESMTAMKEIGIWIEVTTLLIPGINDDARELQGIAEFIAQELGPETPWHLSRYHPSYRHHETASTPLQTLDAAREAGAAAGLVHIYLGNVGNEIPTCCSGCREVLIRRHGFRIVESRVSSNGTCPSCGVVIAGVGMGTV